MAHRLSQNARHTNDLLEELERDKELEVLREYLTRFNLFPRSRDPAAAPIRFEELKELVKHWKLHRQRNFWKTHTTKEDLVRTLYRHINTKIIPQEGRDGESSSVSAGVPQAPHGVGSSGNVAAVAVPTAPPRKASVQGSITDSPRSRSILAGVKLNHALSAGPKKEHIFDVYGGDLFSQRGDYEDGMIYLSRFSKPGTIDVAKSLDGDGEGNQDTTSDLVEETQQKMHDIVDAGTAMSKEVRLKQECAFSLYHFTTDVGNESQMIQEGSMLALSRLSVFDDIEVKRFCAAAILNLAWDNTLSIRMIEEGVLLALLELAKAQHEEIRRNTSMALCRFSYERTGQIRLVQEGCVSAIISMLNSPDNDTKEACVKALINIASHSGASVAESVVQTILKISTRKELASISFSAEAICNLSLLSGPRAKVIEDGILDNLCELSQSVADTDVKIHLATALCNFSGITPNLELLSQVRVLECIEDLLKFENDLVREMCSVAIANISSHPASLKNLVLSDAVVQLVELALKSNAVIQENTALTLSNMSVTSDSRPLLSRFGVVSLLIHFLDEATSVAKQYAIVTLCSLMASPATCTELMQSNVPGVLARLVFSPQDKVRELCANALFNLSCDKTVHSFLLKDDVIKAIIRLCKRHTINKDGILEFEDEPPLVSANDKTPNILQRSQECAIGCVYNLSFFEESRKILLRVDIIKTFFNIFQRPVKNDDFVKQCACVVANLTFDSDSRPRMVEDGCVRLIRKLMNSTSKDTLLCCSTACCNLAAEGLEKTPILSMLIDLSNSPHSNITLNCAIAFSKLASNAAYRPVLTKCAELYPALTLMMRCGIEDIQIYSAVALCNLAIERTQRSRHVWKEGTVPDFIVNSLLRINSESTKEICARALFNLLTHDEHRMAHIKDGVLYALVKLARLESVEIRSLCVLALYNLSCDPVMIDTLMEINVAQVITKMCEIEFSNQEIHRRLAACLNNIAMRSGTEVKLVENGALLAVIVLSEHNDPPTMRYCSSVLSSLSCQRTNCEAMAATSIIDVLTKVISAADDEQQNIIGLNALCNVSCVPALHDRIEESGVISQVMRVLSLSDKEEISLACAKVLCNFTYHTKYRKSLLDKDLVNILLVLFSRNPLSEAVVSVCIQIVSILCEDVQSVPDLIRSGAVQVLRLIAPYCHSRDAIGHCMYALSQLARAHSTALTVIDSGAMDVIAAALTAAPLSPASISVAATANNVWTEVAERCAVVLRTLSVNGECLQPMIEDGRLISFFRAISEARSKEADENCIIALYNITCCKSPILEVVIGAGVTSLLILLANRAGEDLAPVCAIALAHIKHIYKDRDPPVNLEGNEIHDEMEDGMITTLTSMVDLDQPTIQKLDRIAMALPTNHPPTRPSEWIFLGGNNSSRLHAQIPVAWAFQSSAIDDARFVPPEPKSFAQLLTAVLPPTGVCVQDKVYGSFKIMKVRHDKFHIKRVDPRFLRASSASVEFNAEGMNIADAVAAALESDAEIERLTRGRSERDEALTLSDRSSEQGLDEVRSASPTKKKSSAVSKGLSRSGSNRVLNEPGMHRRGSKTGHKGSKTMIVHEPKMSKRDSQRKPHFSSTTSSSSIDAGDRGVILPRL